MEFDFEKLFRNLATEGSLFILGVLSLLISIYNEYILGMKLGFLFLLFGAIFRFYNLSIVRGIMNNYLHKPEYLEEKKRFDKETNKYVKEEMYVIPFKDSWYIHLIDFLFCLVILYFLVLFFFWLISGLPTLA